ncbi:MAG TPA: hypothetical protein VK155_14605 [Bacteroidales bacterium]|jgi:predicted  nucleic acid-binding Zn-ribbon protein|nr:hypothetical protein [Bacteroidales bacterium]
MKRKDKKEKYIQMRGESQDLMKRFDMEMKMARKQPKIYYSQEGQIKTVK